MNPLDTLHVSVGPGITEPAYQSRRHRVSAADLARSAAPGTEADAVEAMRIIADRVSDCVRLHAERLLDAGAIDYTEAQDLVWAVEAAAGASTHCRPGYGPHEMSILDSGGLATLADRMGTGVLLGDNRGVDHCAATIRGVMTQVAKGLYGGRTPIGAPDRATALRDRVAKLSDGERARLAGIAADLRVIADLVSPQMM